MTNRKKIHSRLALIRHGESEWNAKGLWTGWTDVPLTDRGRNEARDAAKLIIDIQFHHGFTSDLMRAYETLTIIRKHVKIDSFPYKKESAFKERHYGIYTGKNKWQIMKEVGEVMFQRIRRGWNVPIPQGETLKDVYGRVIPAYNTQVSSILNAGKNVMFVAHGNSNRALIKHLENIPDEKISEIEMVTGEVIIYMLDKEGNVIGKEKRK